MLFLDGECYFLDGFIISGAVVLMAAKAALSKEGVLPKIDLEKQCYKDSERDRCLDWHKKPERDSCVKVALRWDNRPAFFVDS
jgi:hypothetical protein